MLGVIREYADEASEANGDAEEMRNRHAAYFLVLAEAEPHLDNAKAAEWVIRLEEEHDNLRAALRWSLAEDPEKAARLAAGLINFWILHGHLTQGREWLDEVLKRGNKISLPMRRKILTTAGPKLRSGLLFCDSKAMVPRSFGNTTVASDRESQIASLTPVSQSPFRP